MRTVLCVIMLFACGDSDSTKPATPPTGRRPTPAAPVHCDRHDRHRNHVLSGTTPTATTTSTTDSATDTDASTQGPSDAMEGRWFLEGIPDVIMYEPMVRTGSPTTAPANTATLGTGTRVQAPMPFRDATRTPLMARPFGSTCISTTTSSRSSRSSVTARWSTLESCTSGAGTGLASTSKTVSRPPARPRQRVPGFAECEPVRLLN